MAGREPDALPERAAGMPWRPGLRPAHGRPRHRHPGRDRNSSPGSIFPQEQHLDALVNQTGQPFKLFVGHAGWGPGRLEQEIDQGGWLSTPATLDQVFDTGEDLWQRVLESIRGPMLGTLLGIKHIPTDPRLN